MEKILLLKKVPLFFTLRLGELQHFSERIEVRAFEKGEVICEEGKAGGQALYVVAAGQLNVLLKDNILSTISIANYFGEVSLVSGEPHSATIKAVTSGKLLVIKKELFEEMVKNHPEILRWLSQVLGKKLRQTIKFSYQESEFKKIFAVLSNEAGTGKSVLSANLAASFFKQTGKKTIVVDFYFSPGSCGSLLKIKPPTTLARLLKKGKRITPSNIQTCVVKHPSGLDVMAFHKAGESIQIDRRRLSGFFRLLKRMYELVVVDVPSGLNSEQMKAFMEDADGVVFLVKEKPYALHDWGVFLTKLKGRFPNIDSKLWTGVFLEGNTPKAKLPISCRFLQPYDKRAVNELINSGTPFVNSQSNCALSRAIDRLAREIGGIRVGLALSAGMASGLAHIGVLKVLQRENIPIDILAGTSGGALYGTPFAAGIKVTEVEKAALKIGKLKMLSMLDFTMPYGGFIRGRRIVDFIRSFIGNLKFADLGIPLKVITTDFYTGEIFVMERGMVIDALQASISVPGIITPYNYEGRFLVDGATISPLPVDTLFRAGAEKVIAVNTCVDPLLSHKTRKLPHSFGKMPPHFFDVITHSRAITSQHMAEIESRKADVTVYPDISSYRWRDYHLAEQIIGAGEKAAEAALPKIKNLLRITA